MEVIGEVISMIIAGLAIAVIANSLAYDFIFRWLRRTITSFCGQSFGEWLWCPYCNTVRFSILYCILMGIIKWQADINILSESLKFMISVFVLSGISYLWQIPLNISFKWMRWRGEIEDGIENETISSE